MPNYDELPQALVIIPFATVAQAQEFAVLAQVASPTAHPIVTHGTAYIEQTEEPEVSTTEVFELFTDSNWEVYVSPESEEHHIIRRPLTGG